MLLDLDELVLRCRDDRARTYIAEAVACYKAGAYRSAIVAAWIAVAFDIVDKVLELAATGDKAAVALATDLEKHIEANDYQKALGIERTLLARARDDFELISQQEYLELDRLQQDRHRCAHPTRSSATQVFNPSAELARLHIRNAVECLLEHAPAQGKAALSSLLAQVESKYFPQKAEDARKQLDGSALRKARNSLVRNFLLALVKKSLDPACSYRLRTACATAISYTIDRYPVLSAEVLKKELGRLFAALGLDEELLAGLKVLAVDKLIAASLVDDQVTRIQEFVRSMPAPLLSDLDVTLQVGVPRIQEAARLRAARATIKEIRDEIPWLPEIFHPRVVSAYVKAANYDEANAWGKVIGDYADDLGESDIRKIMEGAKENGEIKNSFQFPAVVDSLRKRNKHLPADFEELAAAVYAKEPDAPDEAPPV